MCISQYSTISTIPNLIQNIKNTAPNSIIMYTVQHSTLSKVLYALLYSTEVYTIEYNKVHLSIVCAL